MKVYSNLKLKAVILFYTKSIHCNEKLSVCQTGVFVNVFVHFSLKVFPCNFKFISLEAAHETRAQKSWDGLAAQTSLHHKKLIIFSQGN